MNGRKGTYFLIFCTIMLTTLFILSPLITYKTKLEEVESKNGVEPARFVLVDGKIIRADDFVDDEHGHTKNTWIPMKMAKLPLIPVSIYRIVNFVTIAIIGSTGAVIAYHEGINAACFLSIVLGAAQFVISYSLYFLSRLELASPFGPLSNEYREEIVALETVSLTSFFMSGIQLTLSLLMIFSTKVKKLHVKTVMWVFVQLSISAFSTLLMILLLKAKLRIPEVDGMEVIICMYFKSLITNIFLHQFLAGPLLIKTFRPTARLHAPIIQFKKTVKRKSNGKEPESENKEKTDEKTSAAIVV